MSAEPKPSTWADLDAEIIDLSSRKSFRQGFDPYAEARHFPDRWRAYLHAHFRNHMQVAVAFDVSERAARKWWQGEGACNGAKVSVAIGLHGAEAARILFFPAGA